MRHPGTKKGRPGARLGYRWYDPRTGRIDRCRLALDAARDPGSPAFESVPHWLAAIPECVPEATAVDLARIDAMARRLYLEWDGISDC